VHWEKDVPIGAKQYKSQLPGRAGITDWREGYENAKKGIELIENKEDITN